MTEFLEFLNIILNILHLSVIFVLREASKNVNYTQKVVHADGHKSVMQ